MAAALHHFNEELAKQPLVFADEKMPTDHRGAPRTEELRELITRTEFSLNRKFQQPILVKGAIRAVLAANNLKLISSRAEDFTIEDAQALADRFLFVVPHPYARDWLIERKNVNQEFTNSLVEGGRVAKHALWLSRAAQDGTRPIARGGRLIVPGNADELTRQILTSSGVNWSVLKWIWSFLQDPQAHRGKLFGKQYAAIVKAGAVWVSPRRLIDSWDDYMGGDRPPTQERMAAAARGLLLTVKDGGRYTPKGRGDSTRYQRLKLEELEAWCLAQGEDTGELVRLLQVDTENAEPSRFGAESRPN
jgi:hypothetical protein